MRTAGRISSSTPRPPGAAFITMSEVVLEKSDISILLEQLQHHTSQDDGDLDIDDAERC